MEIFIALTKYNYEEHMWKWLSHEPKKQILNSMHLMMVAIQKVSLYSRTEKEDKSAFMF